MPLFEITNNSIQKIATTTFSQAKMLERQDLQSRLRSDIDVISPDPDKLLVVAEEFSEWEDSRRSIDLLGVDKEANLVVIELKRTEDGGHMELQAIRYAAMIATLTFEKLVAIYGDFLKKYDNDKDPTHELLDFLGWDEPEEDKFGQQVKIVLASGGFSKELTTSVLWLNEFDLDIRCVRMQPYDHDGQILLDVQTIIPMPETEDYQVQIQEKRRKEKESRKRDTTKYDIVIDGDLHRALNNRKMIFHLVSSILEKGDATPQRIIEVVPGRGGSLFKELDGELNAEQFQEIMKSDNGGTAPSPSRYFYKEDHELFHFAPKTYALSNQWDAQQAVSAAESLRKAFPKLRIEFRPTGT
ncbi:MAG: hypothetical protein OXF66_09150 [Gammaproteobacteria bacterium]|nr:hypothetical protein [Gammaproteobacteria bacterium]MCY4340210.1 hypothetical protein [Gammaproteobacteria bacterium]